MFLDVVGKAPTTYSLARNSCHRFQVFDGKESEVELRHSIQSSSS
jgi:hypothetical protein